MKAMDIDKSNFFRMLPTMLYEAQRARFVAVDLEMSGISSNQERTSHKALIQDSYTRIKDAAGGFQILQIGFTFFHYDEKISEYTTRTFNCQVSPLFPTGYFPNHLSRYLDRKFSVSAKSYSFLRQHRFDFHDALDNGVYYLSREEQRAAERFCESMGTEEHIDPSTLDDEHHAFYESVIAQIGVFIDTRFQMGRPAVIRNPYGDKLSKLQTRLVYQIIREKYPFCSARRVTTGSLAGSMFINPIKEAAKPQWESENMDTAKKLSGLRILFEALAGGSFAENMNREWVSHNNTPTDSLNELNKKFNFYRCEASLEKSRPILVGHNLFQDLAFIYQTFFEPLPHKVEDFLARINELFPRIVDTKFMHIRSKHMTVPNQSLQELYNYYAKLQYPIISCCPDFNNGTAGAHNAGFDSAMTAVLFLKQTHALFVARKHLDDTPEKPANKAKEGISPGTDVSGVNIIDEEEDEMIGALQKWGALFEDKPPSKQPNVGETRSAKELHIIPPWTDPFWEPYGNKTFIAGAGQVSFV